MVAGIGRNQLAALRLVRVLSVFKPILQRLRDGFSLADFVLFEIGRCRRQPSFLYEKRRLCSAAVMHLGTKCPEVSACDEAPQSKVETVQLIYQPLRDGRDAIGRDQKGKDKEHDPAQRLAADEQGHGKQGQHHTGHNENRSCHAEQKRHHGGQNG